MTSSKSDDDGLSTEAIAGIVVGVLLGVCLLACSTWLLLRRRQRRGHSIDNGGRAGYEKPELDDVVRTKQPQQLHNTSASRELGDSVRHELFGSTAEHELENSSITVTKNRENVQAHEMA